MKKLLAFAIAFCGLSTLATAQVPGGNIFVGYSYFNADSNTFNQSSFNGWNGSLEGKIFPFVGIVADIGGYYRTQNIPATTCSGVPGSACAVSTNIYSAMFGPRVSFSVARIRPFAHALVGVAHSSSDLASDTSLANSFGGGVDLHLLPLLGWRFQGDALRTRLFSGHQNNFRFSTGLVINF